MKRKLEDLAAKLAFDELEAAEVEKLRRLATDDAETERAVREYAAMREDLKRLGERTPEPTLSTERLRDAILKDGLEQREKRPGRPGFSWVWAPVATAVLAYAFASYVHRQAPPSVAGQPSIVGEQVQEPKTDLNPPPIAQSPTPQIADKVVERRQKPAAKRMPKNAAVPPLPGRGGSSIIAVARIYDPEWDWETYVVERNDRLIRGLSASAPEPSNMVIARADRSFQIKSFPAGDRADKPKNAPIVIIQPETDGQTGAQCATEVESVANVLVGG
jgi:hypothetical protein